MVRGSGAKERPGRRGDSSSVLPKTWCTLSIFNRAISIACTQIKTRPISIVVSILIILCFVLYVRRVLWVRSLLLVKAEYIHIRPGPSRVGPETHSLQKRRRLLVFRSPSERCNYYCWPSLPKVRESMQTINKYDVCVSSTINYTLSTKAIIIITVSAETHSGERNFNFFLRTGAWHITIMV